MIIDNFLPKYYLKELQDYFLGDNCEWHYSPNTTHYCPDDNELGSMGFSLNLYVDGNYFPTFSATLCRSLITASQEIAEDFSGHYVNPYRARADMTIYNPDKFKHSAHTDYDFPHTTAIFYLNTSDGNTLLLNDDKIIKEVEPVENRLFVFDGLTLHTGHSPSKHKQRVLINMNFTKK